MARFNEYRKLFEVYCTNGAIVKQYEGIGKHLILDPERIYGVGIDQSTKQTGVYIKTLDSGKPVKILMDIVNKGLPDKETYMCMMKMLFREIFDKIKVAVVIAEVPIENSKMIYTRARLEELKGMINSLKLEIPAFETAEFFSMPPNVWRKHYLADDRYKGRRVKTELVKESAEEEGLLRYSKFELYTQYFGRVMDSFDAMGILEGGLKEIYWDENRQVKRINSTMRATVKNYSANFDVIPMATESIQEYVEEVVGYEISNNEEFIEKRGIRVYVADEIKNGIDDIIASAVSSTNSVCLIVFKLDKEKEYELFKWATELVKGQDECYVCVAWRENYDLKKADLDSYPSWMELQELFEKECLAQENAENGEDEGEDW